MRLRAGCAGAAVCLSLFGAPPAGRPVEAGIELVDIATAAGLTHVFPNGGEQSKEFIIETTGSGAALFDYDNDGLLDAFVVSGPGSPSRLYRNRGAGRFSDVTAEAGLGREGWGQGVCAADYDNDGDTDLFVTYWGQNSLYRNEGGRRFQDVAGLSGLKQDRIRYNAGCAWLDYDRDGRLDLFVSNYLKFSFEETPKPGANPYCWYLQLAVNCGPRGLPFDRNLLYRQRKDGTFEDVSEKSGIAAPAQSYCLTALASDFDNDGWPDIFVACDQTPSLLYINNRDGTFSEEGVLRGAAFDDNGKAMSGMGASAADYNHSGWLSIFRSNFSDERETLYRNRGGAEFEDVTVASGMAHNTKYVGWGCGWLDLDHDGWKDLLLVNGHVFPEVDRKNIEIKHRQRRILYRNTRDGRFEDISEKAGEAIRARHSSRGLALGDIDNDGTVEALINNQGERPTLLRLKSRPPGNWVMVGLQGTTANRSAIGARVRVTADGVTQTDEVRSGSGYLSHSDFRLHFGVGKADGIESLEIRWPDGNTQVVKNLPANRHHTFTQAAK